MAGISSSLAWFAFAKQTAKGTAAATPAAKAKYAGAPSLAVFKNRGEYPATDIARTPGNRYTSLMGVAGDVPLLVEPTFMDSLWYYALGATAATGAGDPYTKTATPASDLPYFTAWRMLGNVVNEKFVDCKMNRLEVSGAAGGHFMCTLGITGISSVWDASPPAITATDPAGYLFPEIQGAAKFDTVAQRIHNFTFTVDNGLSPYQADDYIYNDIDPGKQTATITFATRFASATAFPDYRAFFYGSDAGTTLSSVVGDHALDITFTRSATRTMQILVPRFSYAGVPIGGGDPGGAPIEVAVTGEVETPVSGSMISAIVLNANPTAL